MPGIKLEPNEQKLYDDMTKNLDKIKKDIHENKLSSKELEDCYKEMASSAHQLHLSLAERGHEPKHHGYMIKNRRMESNDPRFYDHVHPTEDLVDFIRDTEANNDPEDQTLGTKFKIRIFTRRWGHEDVYQLTRTESGWYLEQLTYKGDCERNGYPLLFRALDHDSVNYPKDLGEYLEWLWERAKEDGLNFNEVQDALNQLASWISICEKNSPLGIFQGYK
ncbi:hypothetical protein [Bacillus sp. MMSF_3328]|uniref:hypothetical protein n=1 Tax=Bacillus sp. MMSF_3328 TaxID=3047080 RepID=UPI00273D67CC|nr:hypothetical protein [Bacillus sp. MMSF_3328]